MKNVMLHRIENQYKKGNFSVRTYTVAKRYNLKTVGKLRQFCIENPTIPNGYFRGRTTWRILKEVEEYISSVS